MRHQTQFNETTQDLGPVRDKSAPPLPRHDYEREVKVLPRLGRQLVLDNEWRVRLLVLADGTLAALSALLAFCISPNYSFFNPPLKHASPAEVSLLFGAFLVVAALASGLYERRGQGKIGFILIRTGAAVLSAWGLVLIATYVFNYLPVGRLITLISITATWASISTVRILFAGLGKDLPINVVLVAGPSAASLILREVNERGDSGLRIVGTVPNVCPANCEVEGLIEKLRHLCRDCDVDTVVVQEGCDPCLLEQVVELLKQGIQVESFVDFFETYFEKVPVEIIDSHWAISAKMRLITPMGSLLKRVSDVLIALAGLAATLPLWPFLAVAIKVSSRGPVFYTQQRVGRRGKVFSIVKFRTMCDGAESDGKACWTSENDERIVPGGRFLRRMRLDELPQFLNVLKGEMSVVGPRPERPEFVAPLEKRIAGYTLRHLVKPGITGWAQINYRYCASLQEAQTKLGYDLHYVRHGTLSQDLRILVRTIGALAKGSR